MGAALGMGEATTGARILTFGLLCPAPASCYLPCRVRRGHRLPTETGRGGTVGSRTMRPTWPH
eukprot:3635183-Lingulodinium_polyedra.AAC.1